MRAPVQAYQSPRPRRAQVPLRRRRGELQAGAARLTLLALLVCGATSPLHAAEHITLRNGFALDCDHRAAEGEGVRLFLDAAENNYLDVKLEEIASAEAFVPVPVPIAAPGRAGTPTGAASQAAQAAHADLTPAELHELLAGAGTEHNLDIDLLASLVHAESGSHVRAVSRTGAQGLMQLMPGTAAQLGVSDAFEPDSNVHGGTAYLDSLLRRYHDNLALALAAYNAGPGAVDRYHGVPPYRETRAYVARIIQEFNRRYAARQAATAAAAAAGHGADPARSAQLALVR